MDMSYLIVRCPYCGDVRAVNFCVKTFQCFTCGRRIKMSKSLILFKTDDRNIVPVIVMKFKEKFLRK